MDVDMQDAAATPPRGRRLSGTRAAQQRALDAYAILDTPRDAAYDELAQLAADVCGCPFAGITFLDWSGARQFWKSGIGLPPNAATSVPLPNAAAEAQNVCCQARAARAPPRGYFAPVLTSVSLPRRR